MPQVEDKGSKKELKLTQFKTKDNIHPNPFLGSCIRTLCLETEENHNKSTIKICDGFSNEIIRELNGEELFKMAYYLQAFKIDNGM